MKHFGGLPFGASEKDAVAIFGEPEEKETLEAIDGSFSAVWHYWSKGFSLFFDQPQGGHFCCVEADSSVSLRLWDTGLFDLNETQLKALFKLKGFRDMDEENHEWGEKRVSFDDAMADFYFEKGELVSINFGVMPAIDSHLIHPN
jgi:hypothetical protein